MRKFFSEFFRSPGIVSHRIESYRIGAGEGAKKPIVFRSPWTITKGDFSMRSITRLFGALGTLADSVLALAGVIDMASGRLRLHLADDSAPQVTHGSPMPEIVNPGANGAFGTEQPPSTKRGKAKAGP